MARTLRQHVAEAERIMSILGVKTLIPQKGRPAPKRVNADNEQLEYATDIRKIVEENDRTGYAGEFLRASAAAAGEFWKSIPEHPVCPLCLGRAPAERIGKGRVFCVPCGTYVRPKILRGLVSADLRNMSKALNNGGIWCLVEKGERDERRPLAVRLEADRAALRCQRQHRPALGGSSPDARGA